MANYQLEQTGAEVQAILNAVESPDTTPAAGSSNLITSGAVQAAVAGVSAEVTALGQEVGAVDVYNGSNGDLGNANLVHTPVVPTNKGRYAIISTSRPNATGCRYCFGYAITSAISDIGRTDRYADWNGGVAKVDILSSRHTYILDLASYPSAVGISFTIGEYNVNTLQTLRETSFAGYDTRILCGDSPEQLINKLLSIYGERNRAELYNIPAQVAVEYEIGYIANNNGFEYQENQNFVRTREGYTMHLFPGDTITLSSFTDAHFDIRGRRLNNTYFAATPPSNGIYSVLEEGDYVVVVRNLTQRPQVSADDLGKLILVKRNHSLTQMIFALRKETGDAFLNNGSNGNTWNASFVHTEVIPTNGAKYAIIKTTRPNASGCHYAFGYALTNNTADIGSLDQYSRWANQLYKIDANASSVANIIDLSAYPTAVGISFAIGEYNASNTQQVLRVEDFVPYSVSIVCDKDLENFIDSMVAGYETSGNRVLKRNKEREIALEAMCRYRKTSSPIKDAQFCICTDSHADTTAVDNAVLATNGFGTIDGFVHCGDITGSYYDAAQITAFQNSLANLTKPGYIVVGNHDVGNAYYVGYCCDHAQAYNAFIKPMVDKGWLVSGEYTANKPYWYHDIATYKIRLIGLYEYDDAMDFNETYWQAITYNSALSNIALSTAYAVGAQVNVPGYTAYSFQAVQAVTTPASYYTTPEKFPSYKVRRGDRVIQQTQAQWFLDKLLGTPANYGVVVILHNPFADDAQVMDVKFSQLKSGTTGASYSQNDMATDLIGGALAAFAAGSNYSVNVAMKGDAAYMNTQGGGTYAYSVSKNFASKNTGVKVFGLLGGHSHRDLVWGKGDLVQVTPICATTNIANATSGDIRRADTDGLTKDSLTVVSFAAQRIGLVKIGVNVTDTGYARDFEVIPVNN